MLYPTIGIPLPGKGILHRCLLTWYTRCLNRAGANVQILKLHPYPAAIAAALSQCDGFLFPGGPDIRPDHYGQERQSGCGEPHPVRDEFELMLLKEALLNQRPLFCIGRGMQLLNVLSGGTLMQDLRFRQEYEHRDPWHLSSATHPVEIDPESLLADILDTDTAAVNSLHHQAVDQVGDGLFISADSPEGFAEALEIDDYPFCLALQWHPEYMAARTRAQQRLFQAFTDACRNLS